MRAKKTILEELEEAISAREKLDRKYHIESEKLTDLFEKLMKELETD